MSTRTTCVGSTHYPQVDEIYKKLDKNKDGHIDIKVSSVNLPPRSHSWSRQEFSEWWESSDRQEGMLDQRLATAIAMREAMDEGLIDPGSLVVTAAFGGGLAWGANVIQF